jgi:hypothetical protein
MNLTFSLFAYQHLVGDAKFLLTQHIPNLATPKQRQKGKKPRSMVEESLGEKTPHCMVWL